MLGSISGIGVGLVIDVIIIFIIVYGFDTTKRMLECLNDEIRKSKFSNQEIKEKLTKMKEEAIDLQNEYNEFVKNYGSFGDEFIIPEIDKSWILKDETKRRRKK